MKKTLLIMAALGAAMGMSAQDGAKQPQVIEDLMITRVSQNGLWAVAEDMSASYFVIYDLANDDRWEYVGNYDEMWISGTGNSVSNTGIVLLSTHDNAMYWEGGEFYDLPIPDGVNTAYANGVTADGSRIIGTVGIGVTIDEDVIMQTPAIWYRQPDGKYGEPYLLPHPTADWTNRTPQYILAQCISNDGKTVAGQMIDYQGFIAQPLVFNEDAEGKWSYAFVHPELINPDNVVIPEDPGEGPTSPDPTAFMTAENAAAYQAAYDAWVDSWFDGNAPDPLDYMSETEQAIYNDAMEAYAQASELFNTELWAFYDALDMAIASSAQFSMNNVFLSPNGRYYATSHQVMGFWGEESVGIPYVFDLVDGTITKKQVEGLPLISSYVNDKGQLLMTSLTENRNIWISDALDAEPMAFEKWVEPKNKEVYDWMAENMRHDLPSFDPDTYEEIIIPDQWVTGTAVADADLSLVCTFVSNTWDYESPIYLYSYILPLGDTAGIDTPVNNGGVELMVRSLGNGRLAINGEPALVEVFDMQGRLMFSQEQPGATVETGISSGAYTVRATDADGNATVLKAMF